MSQVAEKYQELSYYTLSHPDPTFIHQYVVDAFTTQQAGKETKPIKIAFALIGLYLHVEKGYSGKQVQQVHMQLAKQRKYWPEIQLPEDRGEITVADVLDAEPGRQRDEMIDAWCRSVWQAFHQENTQNKTTIFLP